MAHVKIRQQFTILSSALIKFKGSFFIVKKSWYCHALSSFQICPLFVCSSPNPYQLPFTANFPELLLLPCILFSAAWHCCSCFFFSFFFFFFFFFSLFCLFVWAFVCLFFSLFACFVLFYGFCPVCFSYSMLVVSVPSLFCLVYFGIPLTHCLSILGFAWLLSNAIDKWTFHSSSVIIDPMQRGQRIICRINGDLGTTKQCSWATKNDSLKNI